jgi:intein/homing endonuclease
VLTQEKSEIIGALLGDKSLFGIFRRYGHYKGYDYSRYKQGIVRISLGKDEEWGHHLSGLVCKAYGIRGNIYQDKREWVFNVTSGRVVRDLMNWYDSAWNSHSWRVPAEIFDSSDQVKRKLLRGYCDADGSPIFNKSRRQPLIKVESVNHEGLLDVNRVFHDLGYVTHVWRESKIRKTWGLYIIRINELFRFQQEIGFSIKRKQYRLTEILTFRR